MLTDGVVGAKMATLRKYAEAYERLFPASAQVIVLADTLRYWKPAGARVCRASIYIRCLLTSDN